MPRVKSVKSLSKFCVDFILDNENYFHKKFGSPDLGEYTCISPFEHLPTVLLEELAKEFREKLNKYSSRIINKVEFVELMITPHLRTLDVRWSRGNINVLRLAGLKTPDLKALVLGYSRDSNYYGEFLNCIPKFSKLQSLELSLSGAGDDCLKLLGTYCTELRKLYARGSDVSDDGIRGLCVVGNCKSICALVLEGSKVTIKGIQLALSNLPELQVLYHTSLLECLAEIAQTALDEKLLNMPKYSLTSLYILENTIYKSQSLELSVLLCPNITKVHITWNEGRLTDADLLSLRSLENLKTLEIHHKAFLPRKQGEAHSIIDAGLTFNGGVAPLLQTVGATLNKLNLTGFFNDVDIPAIIESCPNLQYLTIAVRHLKKTWSKSEEPRTRNPVSDQLAFLDLYGSVTTENLVALLSSPSLAHIRLSNCPALTDEILHGAAHQHSFRNLEYLKLYHCPSVSKKGIDILFRDTNPLKEIHLTWCARIKNKDWVIWEEILDKQNWDLSMSRQTLSNE